MYCGSRRLGTAGAMMRRYGPAVRTAAAVGGFLLVWELIVRLAGIKDLQRTTAALDDAAKRLSRLFLTQLAEQVVSF